MHQRMMSQWVFRMQIAREQIEVGKVGKDASASSAVLGGGSSTCFHIKASQFPMAFLVKLSFSLIFKSRGVSSMIRGEDFFR